MEKCISLNRLSMKHHKSANKPLSDAYTALHFVCERENINLFFWTSHKEPDAVDHKTIPQLSTLLLSPVFKPGNSPIADVY